MSAGSSRTELWKQVSMSSASSAVREERLVGVDDLAAQQLVADREHLGLHATAPSERGERRHAGGGEQAPASTSSNITPSSAGEVALGPADRAGLPDVEEAEGEEACDDEAAGCAGLRRAAEWVRGRAAVRPPRRSRCDRRRAARTRARRLRPRRSRRREARLRRPPRPLSLPERRASRAPRRRQPPRCRAPPARGPRLPRSRRRGRGAAGSRWARRPDWRRVGPRLDPCWEPVSRWRHPAGPRAASLEVGRRHSKPRPGGAAEQIVAAVGGGPGDEPRVRPATRKSQCDRWRKKGEIWRGFCLNLAGL